MNLSRLREVIRSRAPFLAGPSPFARFVFLFLHVRGANMGSEAGRRGSRKASFTRLEASSCFFFVAESLLGLREVLCFTSIWVGEVTCTPSIAIRGESTLKNQILKKVLSFFCSISSPKKRNAYLFRTVALVLPYGTLDSIVYTKNYYAQCWYQW